MPNLPTSCRRKNFIPLRGMNPEEVLEKVPRNNPIKKDFLGDLVFRCYRKYGHTKTAEIFRRN